MIRTFTGHSATISSLLELSDNLIVSASCDRTIKIWNWFSLEVNTTLIGHTDHVWVVDRLSSDLIISASWDGTLKTWQANKPWTLVTTMSIGSSIFSLLKLNGSLIMIGDLAGKIRIVNFITMQSLAIFNAHTNSIQKLSNNNNY